MKLPTLIVLFSAGCVLLAADPVAPSDRAKTPQKIPSVGRFDLPWMKDQIRVVKGKEYPMAPFYSWWMSGQNVGKSPMPLWRLVDAPALNVNQDGIWLSKIMVLKNHPDQRKLEAGSQVVCAAMLLDWTMGTNALGVRDTIIILDHGTKPDEKRMEEINLAEEKRKMELEAERAAQAKAKADLYKAKMDDLRKRNNP